MDEVAFEELKVMITQYYWKYVNHSKTPESPRRHALAIYDLGDAFDVALVSLGQP